MGIHVCSQSLTLQIILIYIVQDKFSTHEIIVVLVKPTSIQICTDNIFDVIEASSAPIRNIPINSITMNIGRGPAMVFVTGTFSLLISM